MLVVLVLVLVVLGVVVLVLVLVVLGVLVLGVLGPPLRPSLARKLTHWSWFLKPKFCQSLDTPDTG